MGDVFWTSLIKDHLKELGAAIWDGLSHWLYALLRDLALSLWHATLLPIPHETTDLFAPVIAMMPDPQLVAGGGIVLALALLGVRTILHGTTTGHTAAVDYLTGRFIAWAFVLSIMPWLIWKGIEVEHTLAAAVALEDLKNVLPEDAAPNPVALVVMCIFGIRLWLKLASNVVHVAVAVVWSPVAGVFGLIPATAHIGSLWLHEFFGRLAGAVLATIASGIGLALALSNGGGSTFAIVGTAGAFIAAGDLVDWLAKTPGTGIAGLTGQVIRTAALLPGLALPGAGTAAAGTAAAAGTTALATRGPAAMTRYGVD